MTGTPLTEGIEGTIDTNQVAVGTAPNSIGGDNNFTNDPAGDFNLLAAQDINLTSIRDINLTPFRNVSINATTIPNAIISIQGGALDIQANSGDVVLRSLNGLLNVESKNDLTIGTDTGDILLLPAGDISINNAYTIPKVDGNANDVMTTNGLGVGGWQPISIAGITAGGELSGTYPNPTVLNATVLAKLLTGLNIVGSTIVATDTILEAFGKLQNEINGLLGGAIYQGVWNATTNTPTLADGTGTQGNYYVVSVAGNINLGSGVINFNIGDWCIYNGTIWQKVDNTDAVTSVNGFIGAVSLTTADIPEVTNLYFTAARVLTTLLTGYASGAGTVAATDTVLQAIQKLNGNNLLKADIASPTLTGTLTTPAIIVSSETANTVASFDGSKNIKSLALATYPSLTELAFVKGVTSAIQTQIDGKQASLGFTAVPNTRNINTTAPITGGGDLSADRTLAMAAATTAVNGYLAATDFVIFNNKFPDPVYAYQALGSQIVATTLGETIVSITSNVTLVDNRMYFFPVWLPKAQTLTGVKWFQVTIGNYTADNENRIGLYTYSGGTLTLVASTANDGTLWQTAATGTWGIKAFSGTYAASAGLFFIGILWCNSASVTAPVVGGGTAILAAANIGDFTNSAKLFSLLAAQTTLNTGPAMSGLTVTTVTPVFGLY